MKTVPPHPFTKAPPNDTFLPFQVEEYVTVSQMAFMADLSAGEVLFEDAYFYWKVLMTKAENDFEKRESLLKVLAMLRDLGMQLKFTHDQLKIDWNKYYMDSLFLRILLNINKTKTGEVKFSSNNSKLEEAFNAILKSTDEPSYILQRRLQMFHVYHEEIQKLANNPKLMLSELESSEIRSQLGPLQDYFPKFMRERPACQSRSFLAITMSRRYLQKMEQTGYYPSAIMENAGVTFSHFCNIYRILWKSHPRSQASRIFSHNLAAYMKEKVKPRENAISGCTAETFSSAVKIFGIPEIALPPSPYDGQAASLAAVKHKEFRLLLETSAYLKFYKARFQIMQEDIRVHFLIGTPEDKDYAALVQSWIKAKTYPNVKMPFIVTQSQITRILNSTHYALEEKADVLKDYEAWKKLNERHIARRLELEMVVHDLSDDPVWKELQMDYISRLHCFLKQIQ